MSTSSIPAPALHLFATPPVPGRLTDSHGRVITDLRVSVTDRCNYKCVYCRSGEEAVSFAELPMADYLRLVRIFVGLGIEKVRITGGEPLLRRGIVELVRELSALRTAAGERLDLAITTNGHLLETLARPLADAGLTRVTVSMDAVEPATFERITRVPGSFHHVLRGVRAARAAGLGPVKVNCVPAARLERRPDRPLRPLCPRRRRDRALHRVHAARGRPHLVRGHGGPSG